MKLTNYTYVLKKKKEKKKKERGAIQQGHVQDTHSVKNNQL